MKLGSMFPVHKYDVVEGWFGTGTVTDIAEFDDLVLIRQGTESRVVSAKDIERNYTMEENLS